MQAFPFPKATLFLKFGIPISCMLAILGIGIYARHMYVIMYDTMKSYNRPMPLVSLQKCKFYLDVAWHFLLSFLYSFPIVALVQCTYN